MAASLDDSWVVLMVVLMVAYLVGSSADTTAGKMAGLTAGEMVAYSVGELVHMLVAEMAVLSVALMVEMKECALAECWEKYWAARRVEKMADEWAACWGLTMAGQRVVLMVAA